MSSQRNRKKKIIQGELRQELFFLEKSWECLAEIDSLMDKYSKITAAEKEKVRSFFVLKQDYRCAICGRKEDEFGKRLCIDHDHKTDRIRGLLCNTCNFLIGCAQDSPVILNSAIDYLTQESILYQEERIRMEQIGDCKRRIKKPLPPYKLFERHKNEDYSTEYEERNTEANCW